MPKVTFHHDGAAADILEVDTGSTLMHAAVRHGVPGIVGECGGQAMCATCHVYVRPAYLPDLPLMTADEDEMLDCTAAPRDRVRSRLGCQVTVGPDLGGIEVDVPPTQI